jgi:hypothetical protein
MRQIASAARLAAAIAAVILLVIQAFADPASADFADPVECTGPGGNNPHCDVRAENDPVYTDDGDGAVACRQGGEVVPCVNEDGWLGSDGCRYLRLDGVAPPAGVETPGAAYRPTCPEDPPGAQRALVWIPDSDAPGLAQLARIAVSRLAPPTPEIGLSPPPPAPQLVMLPVWLWVDEATWAPRSATASVPGVSVTATATPTRVDWTTGDGGTHTCHNRGEPWRKGMDPRAESPTCGHTYTAPSRSQPGGVYELRATVTWRVSWSGGGSSGNADPLLTTSTTPVQVAESLSRNTGSRP